MTRSKLYLIFQAAVCIAVVVLLAIGAVGIYREGSARKAVDPMESVYTPEIVAERFKPIAPLFFAGIGLLIAGLLLGVKDERGGQPVKDAELSRDLLTARVVRPSLSMLREQRRQKILLLAGWGAFALCMMPIVVYLLDPIHFPQDDPEGMFFGLMRVFLPLTAAGLCALAISSVLRRKSVLRETQAMQAQLKEEKAEGKAPGHKPADPPKKTGVLRAAVIVAAIVFIVMGVLNGSARDVLYKAITICTECVGLG